MNTKIALSASLLVAFLLFVFVSSGGTNGSAAVAANTQTQGQTPSGSFDSTGAPINAAQTPAAASTPTPAPSYAHSDDDQTQSDEDLESGAAAIPNASTPKPAVATPTPKPVTPKPAPAPVAVAPAPKPRGQFTDGTYTGSAIDVYYGIVQVQAIVSGGKLSSVQILQYPNDRQRSVQIAQHALPILQSEAISAQSANVNAVSGASATSDGFRQSLSSALSQAS